MTALGSKMGTPSWWDLKLEPCNHLRSFCVAMAEEASPLSGWISF